MLIISKKKKKRKEKKKGNRKTCQTVRKLHFGKCILLYIIAEKFIKCVFGTITKPMINGWLEKHFQIRNLF